MMNDAPGSADMVRVRPWSQVGRRTLPSLLLGIFILWELFYLPAANLIKLLPVRQPPHKGELNDEVQRRADESAGGPAQAVRDGLAFGLSRWGELTGQTQGWALFAPTFGHQASLPCVSLTWTTPRTWAVHYCSRFEPKNPDYYFRPPEAACRLFNYEYRLALLYWTWSLESSRERREEWREAALQRVRWQQRSMLAYMRWRMDQNLRDNPGRPPPDEVYLVAQLILTPPPDAPSGRKAIWPPGPTMPLARWFPGTPPPPGSLSVQAWVVPPGWVWLPEED